MTLKGWNSKTNVKHSSGRVYTVQIVEAHQFSAHLGCWEVLTGVIYADVSRLGQRSRNVQVARFEARAYPPHNCLTVEIRPTVDKRSQAVGSHDLPQAGDWQTDKALEWIRERIVNTCHQTLTLYDSKEKETA